jgi:AcrR family transcriptional regulator
MYILLVSADPVCYEEAMEMAVNETGWRGSPGLWLGADVLLEAGVDAVKISPLAKKLNLSRTSFYWFFKDREELLAALISLWREKNTGSIVKQANAYAESIVEALLNVSDCWFDESLFDAKLEFAVRSWALQSADVQAEVHKADEQRLSALADVFRRFGHDALSGDVRSRTIYLLQIGYITMQTSEPLAMRMRRMPKYIEVFTDLIPEQRELDRFFARHGYLG